MWCLLLVVKWFTKCLFHGWLLKICFGLSLLLFFFPLFMSCFTNVPPFIPVDWSCHHMHQELQAAEAPCAWRQKQVHTQQSLTSFFYFSSFFSLHIRTSVSSLIMWRMCINVAYYRKALDRRRLHSSDHMLVSRSRWAGSSRFCHASVMLLSHRV